MQESNENKIEIEKKEDKQVEDDEEIDKNVKEECEANKQINEENMDKEKDITEEDKEVSVEENKEVSVEEDKEVSIEKDTAVPIEEDKKDPIEEKKESSIEEDKETSIKEDKEAPIKEEKEASIEDEDKKIPELKPTLSFDTSKEEQTRKTSNPETIQKIRAEVLGETKDFKPINHIMSSVIEVNSFPKKTTNSFENSEIGQKVNKIKIQDSLMANFNISKQNPIDAKHVDEVLNGKINTFMESQKQLAENQVN